MIDWAIYGMVYLGTILMAYNVFCFIRFARFLRGRGHQDEDARILYIPVVLVVLFLAGYIAVAVFGKPDLIIGGILFGGSIFVFIMHRFIDGVTKRVIENERLQAELMAAEESNVAKTSFLSSMSHEMRTPMNVILGLDSIALKNPDLPAETRVQLEKIGQSGKHLLSLINNILDMNSIEAGELAAKEEPFALQDICDQLNAIVETQCEAKGLTFRSFLYDDTAGWYKGDQVLIKQVLLSVLDNAVKYTDAPGNVTLAVSTPTPEESPRIVQFDVSDTGVGIDPGFVNKVFDVFEQEDASATNRHGGSGIGLSAAKSKAELMGGTIAVSSQKNVGSTFVVSIPLSIAEGAEIPQDPAEEALDDDMSNDASTLEGKRVLIVEDLPENAEIVEDLLDLEGADSEHAENGQIAVDMFDRSPEYYYDAVLMDLRMPVMDGLEATRRIRNLDRHDAKTVPILALTANALEQDVQHSLDAGMDVHLAKPVDADQLYAELKRLTHKAREQFAAEEPADDLARQSPSNALVSKGSESND